MIGHNLTEQEIFNRVEKIWDLSGPFPLPYKLFLCPVCRANETIIKQCQFFKRSGHNFRCDVAFKCTVCSAVWPHGVKVPEKMAAKGMKKSTLNVTHLTGPLYTWREMKEIINAGHL